MANASTQFGGFLTNVGTAQQANTAALGLPWNITHMLIGDAGGDPSLTPDPTPDPAQLTLVRQMHRAQLNALYKSPADPSVLVAELVLPPETGGWWIRELGLEDDKGNFIAVAKPPPSYKPLLAQGSGRTQTIRMHVLFGNTANVSLKIDPSIVLATREYVDSRVVEEINKLDNKQSVRVTTTANIALTGLQTIDGVVLAVGDRVLVKSQAAAKDNGIYVAAAGVWARATDADSNAEVTSALLVSVEQGATLADTRWQLVTDGAIILGTTALVFQNITQGFAPITAPVLVDPTANTPPRFDSGKSIATTEFVSDAMGGLRRTVYSLTQGQVITPAMVNAMLYAGGSVTSATLPLLSSVPVGSTLTFAAMSSSITLQRQGADTIWATYANSAMTSIKVNLGDTLTLLATPFGWACVGGSAMFAYQGSSGVFGSLLGVNGYQKLPGGKIIQGGSGATVNGAGVVTFPIAFPNACHQVIAMELGAAVWTATNLTVYGSTGKTKTGVTIKSLTWGGSAWGASGGNFDYIAIGE